MEVFARSNILCSQGNLHRKFKPRHRLVAKRSLGWLDVSNLVHVFYWMNLYVLRLFKKYGAPGFNKDRDFQTLAALAERSTHHTVAMLARDNPGLRLRTLKPFLETWATDDPAVLPIALFNAIYDLLGIVEKPPWPVPVLKFHLCTESAYKISVTMLKDIPDGH